LNDRVLQTFLKQRLKSANNTWQSHRDWLKL